MGQLESYLCLNVQPVTIWKSCSKYSFTVLCMHVFIYLFCPIKFSFPPIKVISAYCVWRLLVLNSQWWVHINVNSSPLVTVGSLPRKQKGVFPFASKLILQGPCVRMKLHLSPIRGSIRF